MARGGVRPGAGRKKKHEEQELVEKLKPYDSLAFDALTAAMQTGESWAVKLFFEYRFGKPVQRTEITGADGSNLIEGIDITIKR